MDQVKVFNSELSSILECRPPISKAKMTSVTKNALKAIKYYKHVVQSVEKFIQKCKPEYKVPGLYVIDSIVRQSRHQHGPANDVFAPRFSKNIKVTLQHLFKCPEDQRPKIVRVLNLWQKNKVFTSDVIQPLLDMAHPDALVVEPQGEQNAGTGTLENNENNSQSTWSGWNEKNDRNNRENHGVKDSENNSADAQTMLDPAQLLQSGVDLSKLGAQGFTNLQQLANQLGTSKSQDTVKFNKKLLDFDYGDEDEEDDKKDEENISSEQTSLVFNMAHNLLSNPELVKQIQQMQQTIQETEAMKSELNVQDQMQADRYRQQTDDFNRIPQPEQSQQAEMMHHHHQQQLQQQAVPLVDPNMHIPMYAPHMVPNYPPPPIHNQMVVVPQVPQNIPAPFIPEPIKEQPDVIVLESESKDVDLRRREEERPRSRSPRHRRRRSKSRSPRDNRRNRRSRSGSRTRSARYGRRDRRSRSRSRDRERDREKERERRKKGLPPLRKNHLSVCSTTLWLGHVPKTVPESEIHDVFGEFGTVQTIDIIPPRGCAYVCMDRRQDAYRALQKLRNLKLQNSAIKMAWAPGKGMKGKQYKDYWDVELGVSFIPCDKIKEDVDLDLLEEGGMFDDESIPQWLRDKIESKAKKGTNLGKMNMDDLVALAEAQAPVKGGSADKKADVSAMAATSVAPVTSAGPSVINPNGVPMMRPMVQPQFQGMPPMPMPGQAMMLPPPQVPVAGFQPGVRPVMVLPPTCSSQPQLMANPAAYPPAIVGSLPMGVTSSPALVRPPIMLPHAVMPTMNNSADTKDESSMMSANISDMKSDSNSSDKMDIEQPQCESPMKGQDDGKNAKPFSSKFRSIGDSQNDTKMDEGSGFHDQSMDGGMRMSPMGMRPPPPMGNSMNMRPHGDVSPGIFGEPIRFSGMRFNNPRMPRMMMDQNRPMRMMGRRMPFPGNDMLGERPWMGQDHRMRHPRPPEFDDERFDQGGFYGMRDERNQFMGRPPPDWHMNDGPPPPRFNDTPRVERWNKRSRWESQDQQWERERWQNEENRASRRLPERSRFNQDSEDEMASKPNERESGVPRAEPGDSKPRPVTDNKQNDMVMKEATSNQDTNKPAEELVRSSAPPVLNQVASEQPPPSVVAPAPVPDRAPTIEAVTEPIAVPETVPEPITVPVPIAVPEPKPEAMAVTEPVPMAVPEAVPEPMAILESVPEPIAVPEPVSQFIAALEPVPEPAPQFIPAPEPVPDPVSQFIPTPEPVPEPVVAPEHVADPEPTVDPPIAVESNLNDENIDQSAVEQN